MMIISFPPSNEWFRPKLDADWWRWFLKCLAYGGLAALLLVSAATPRQERVKLAYKASAMRQEVAKLQREIRALELELNTLMAPSNLERSLSELNLTLPDEKHVFYLSPDGHLHTVPTPTPERSTSPW